MTDLKLYDLNQLSTDLFQPDMSLSKKEKKKKKKKDLVLTFLFHFFCIRIVMVGEYV